MTRAGDKTPREARTAAASRRANRAAASGRLSLVVIRDDTERSFPLPAEGEVLIGRAADCDVRIDHASVSRNHAILRIGAPLTIEDLDSSNGTMVKDVRLRAREPAPLAPGDPIEVGSALLVVQHRAGATARRHIWAHGDFEARLEEECARGHRFALLQITSAGAAPRTVEKALVERLRPMDLVGYFGPGVHEVLLPDAGAAEAGELAARVAEGLPGAQVRVALYPDDGHEPYALFARVAEPPAAAPDLDAMARVHELVDRAARGTISVLLLGETGVGKEVLAERMHRASPRAGGPLLRLNCAAFPSSLLESELFGHERGAFTGADRAKPGLLETANAGTVFLDEIGEMPATIQAKLLRVIEAREVLRVGATRPVKIDVRFVSATHRDLQAAIGRAEFRADLYFRLAGVTVRIPPLRERTSEIAGLAGQFAVESAGSLGVAPPRLEATTLAALARYGWPGNIRELRNVVERAVLLAGSGAIGPAHLPPEILAPAAAAVTPNGGGGERERIVAALEASAGNQTAAARKLGMSLRTLVSRLDRYGLPRPRRR